MPAAYKEQTQLLIAPRVKAMIEELAVVRGESMAEVSRVALDMALKQMGKAHASNLAELREVLEAMKVDYAKAVHAMVSSRPRIGFNDLFDENGHSKRSFPGVLR